MSEANPKRIFHLDGDITCLPEGERDEVFLKKYGMTFAEWQTANPPPTEEEWKELFKRSKFK